MQVLSVVSFLFACVSATQLVKRSSCSRKLEGIVHIPETCAFKQMGAIFDKIAVYGPALFRPAEPEILLRFAHAYGANIVTIDALGNKIMYTAAGTVVELTDDTIFRSVRAQANLNLPGFSVDPDTGFYYYMRNIFNKQTGELIQLAINFPNTKSFVC